MLCEVSNLNLATSENYRLKCLGLHNNSYFSFTIHQEVVIFDHLTPLCNNLLIVANRN